MIKAGCRQGERVADPERGGRLAAAKDPGNTFASPSPLVQFAKRLLALAKNQMIAAGGAGHILRFDSGRCSANDQDRRRGVLPNLPQESRRPGKVGFETVVVRVVEIADAQRDVVRLFTSKPAEQFRLVAPGVGKIEHFDPVPGPLGGGSDEGEPERSDAIRQHGFVAVDENDRNGPARRFGCETSHASDEA
jgi:hypothetical protein